MKLLSDRTHLKVLEIADSAAEHVHIQLQQWPNDGALERTQRALDEQIKLFGQLVQTLHENARISDDDVLNLFHNLERAP